MTFSPVGILKAKYRKHKKWFIALLALDILCIPAAAQIVDRVSFSVPQSVAAAQIPVKQAGLQRFVVASNAPFVVISEKAIGEFNVKIQKKDEVHGFIIGENAQLPGAAKGCAVATSMTPQKIYEAERKTAIKRGDAITQSVLIELRYDPALSPEFKIITQDEALNINAAGQCSLA